MGQRQTNRSCRRQDVVGRFFDKDKLLEWEHLDKADQSWENVQDYFTALLNDDTRYAQATAGKSNWFAAQANKLTDTPSKESDEPTDAQKEVKDANMMLAIMQK